MKTKEEAINKFLSENEVWPYKVDIITLYYKDPLPKLFYYTRQEFESYNKLVGSNEKQ